MSGSSPLVFPSIYDTSYTNGECSNDATSHLRLYFSEIKLEYVIEQEITTLIFD